MAQYDDIAESYQTIKSLTYYEIAEYSLLHYVGEIKGKSILDLACGEGFHTRRYKEMGASQVMGVDISKEMIDLARQEEARNPLGIEYLVSSVEGLGKIGEFDAVIAIFLLHYAQTKEQLLEMCQAIYDNLKPGERFVTINGNPDERTEYPSDAFKAYGVESVVFTNPGVEGSAIETVLAMGDEKVKIETYYHRKETYEWALSKAGFKTVRWHGLLLPPHLKQAEEIKFWKVLLDAATTIIIECEK